MKNIVLVTGGSSGIGLAIAKLFAQKEYLVAVNYRSFSEELENLSQQFPKNILCIQGDITKDLDRTHLFEATESHWGKVNILINNAGIVLRRPIDAVTEEEFRHTVEVNTIAPFFLSREFVKRLEGSSGSIVNIGSLQAFFPSNPDYAVSKAGIHVLTQTLAKHFAPQVRVNAIAPGFTDTPMHAENHARLEKEGEKSLLQKYATPKEIAESVFFFASDASSSTTGQILLVDNGWCLVK